MGEVYRARDTKLNRDVALKVLPAPFAADPERLARLMREAQLLASLNHPNIASIHGLEDAGDTRALVLELVEGPTLADRIAQGPLPLDEALAIARADPRRPRGGARARHRSPRSEASQHQGPKRRHGQSARLRIGEGARAGRGRECRSDDVADPVDSRNAGRADSRHRCLHESGASGRQTSGQAQRYLGVRRGLAGDADRWPGVYRRERSARSGIGPEERSRLVQAAVRYAGAGSTIAASMPREGPQATTRFSSGGSFGD